MTIYEELLQKVADEGFTVHEHWDLGNSSTTEDNYLLGLCCGSHIVLAQELETDADRRSILAEEYGHAIRNGGNILDQSDIENRKQERKVRLLSYDMLFGIDGIAKALMDGCRNTHEMAFYLNVSEKVLKEALECYNSKYGQRIETDDYDLYFEPCLMVVARNNTQGE